MDQNPKKYCRNNFKYTKIKTGENENKDVLVKTEKIEEEYKQDLKHLWNNRTNEP